MCKMSHDCHWDVTCHISALLTYLYVHTYVGAPTIHCYEPSKAVTPGSLVSFVCKVQAYPGPVTISWDGSRARTDVSNVGIRNKNFAFSNIVNAWNSTLSFKDFVEGNDTGLYRITAQNMHGAISAMVELQVQREFTVHPNIILSTYVRQCQWIQCRT